MDWWTSFQPQTKDSNSVLEEVLFAYVNSPKILLTPKCVFHTPHPQWFRRILDETSYCKDRLNRNALKVMQNPAIAEQLSQFIHSLIWMVTSIPDLYWRMIPLEDILQAAYQLVERWKKLHRAIFGRGNCLMELSMNSPPTKCSKDCIPVSNCHVQNWSCDFQIYRQVWYIFGRRYMPEF